MKIMSLKLKMHMKSVSIINNNIERLILNIIFGSLGILALFYILILGNMVSDIVQRRSLETDARALSGEVRNLELTYLSMSSNVDLPLSYSLGFRETRATFATRKTLGLKSSNSVKILQNDI